MERTGHLRGLVAPSVILAVAAVAPAYAQLNCNPGVEFYPEGPIKQCVLNGNHRVHTPRGDVVVCADGHPLVQFPDGRLQSCTVAEPTIVAGKRCEPPSRVEIGEDGALERCAGG